jgi:hypothetical protein
MSDTQKSKLTVPLAPVKSTKAQQDALAASGAGQDKDLIEQMAGASDEVRTLNADLDGAAQMSVDDEVALVSDQMSGEYIGEMPVAAAGLFGGAAAAVAGGSLLPLAALAGLGALAAGSGGDDNNASPPASPPPAMPPIVPDTSTPTMMVADGNSGLAGASENLETISANNGGPTSDGAIPGGIESVGNMIADGGAETPLAFGGDGVQDITGSTTTEESSYGVLGGADTLTMGMAGPVTGGAAALSSAIDEQDPSMFDALLGEGGGALAQDALVDTTGFPPSEEPAAAGTNGDAGVLAPVSTSIGSNAGGLDSLIAGNPPLV